MRNPKVMEEMPRTRAALPRDGRGFSMVELVVVLAVISIVLTFAVLGVRRAMASVRLQNSMRQLASRVEAARIDAIRRHQSATVEFTSDRAYSITMDFNGTGVVGKRSYTLESGVTINVPVVSGEPAPPVFDFDWRGRTPQCFTSITMRSREVSDASTLSVTSAGDVTVDAGLSANMNAGTFTAVSATGDVATGAVVSGAGAPACSDPCGGCVPAGGGGPQGSTPPPGCVAFFTNKTFISIRKNLKTSDGFVISVTPADTITVVQTDGRSNLEFTPSPTQAIGAGGTKTFTVKSKGNTTGFFPVKFISACNPSNSLAATVEVKP
jgi:prepilin-type N-terminal cleavage/methylation domain-containing protein